MVAMAAASGPVNQDGGTGGTGVPGSVEVSRRSVLRLAGLGVVGGTSVTACAEASEGSGAGSRRISVTDQRGEKVTVDGPVRRIVTIPMPAAAMVIAVDKGIDHLAGMHEASWVAIRDGIMGEMFPAAIKIPHGVATQEFAPNVESVVALDPDVVVQWGDEGTGIVGPLENAGLDVVGLSYGTHADLTKWITLFGALLGQQRRAKRLNGLLADRKAEITDSAPASAVKPSIVYFNRFEDGLKVAARDSYNDFYIDLIGGTNPTTGKDGLSGSGMVGVDVEQVLAWDPEVLLLGNFDAAVPADVYRNKIWQAVSAVKERRVYKVPLGGYRWDPPSHESALMWRWLSAVAFPERRAGSELRAEVVRDYRFLYGHQLTDAQLDGILQLDVNASSADYRQFHAG